MLLYSAAQVLWWGSHVVVGFRQCMLYCEGGPGYTMRRVLQLSPASCALLLLLLYPVVQGLWLGSCYIGSVRMSGMSVCM